MNRLVSKGGGGRCKEKKGARFEGKWEGLKGKTPFFNGFKKVTNFRVRKFESEYGAANRKYIILIFSARISPRKIVFSCNYWNIYHYYVNKEKLKSCDEIFPRRDYRFLALDNFFEDLKSDKV